MRHIQNILVAFPSARDLYCDFFQQISLNFCSRNIYNALQNILQQEQKVHVVCTVVCPWNWNNAQLDNLFNIKRTKIYSISTCYYPSPGVVIDHVLKLYRGSGRVSPSLQRNSRSGRSDRIKVTKNAFCRTPSYLRSKKQWSSSSFRMIADLLAIPTLSVRIFMF